MPNWISLTEAIRQLGVRPQTMYAYVSRGRVAVIPDPRDPRKSLYRGEDVAGLRKRKQQGRNRETLAAGTIFGDEPCIYTALTSFARGRPFYRGQDVIRLSGSATLEEMAALLWGAESAIRFGAASAPAQPAGAPGGSRTRAFSALAALAAQGHSTHGRIERALHAEAGDLVGTLTQAFGALPQDADLPLHQQFAKAWGQDLAVAEHLRKSMVLVADHELTSSAFAARIAASTGASLPACLLAGLATFSGPLHGDASMRVRAMFDDLGRLGADKLLAHHLQSAIAIPGFGHHLYPDGDPRAAALLADFSPAQPIRDFIQKVEALTGLRPNIDIALAALVDTFGLPADAAFALFASARSVGLLAHCFEQLQVGMVIRPRGRYTGPALEAWPAEPPATPAADGPSSETIRKNRIFK